MVGKEPLPGLVAETLGHRRRTDDVGEHERREDPLAARGLAKVQGAEGDIDQDSRLVADHRRVVPARDEVDRPGQEIDDLAVIHLDAHVT